MGYSNLMERIDEWQHAVRAIDAAAGDIAQRLGRLSGSQLPDLRRELIKFGTDDRDATRVALQIREAREDFRKQFVTMTASLDLLAAAVTNAESDVNEVKRGRERDGLRVAP